MGKEKWIRKIMSFIIIMTFVAGCFLEKNSSVETFADSCENYLVFVYDETIERYEQFNYNGMLKSGAFYSVDLEKRQIYLLEENGVSSFVVTPREIYYFLEDVLYSIGFMGTGKEQKMVLENGNPIQLRYSNESVFYISNNWIYSYDLKTKENKKLLEYAQVIGILGIVDGKIFFAIENEEKTLMMYNINTSSLQCVPLEEYELTLTNEGVGTDWTQNQLNVLTQLDPNILEITNNYTIGTYYSTTGAGCACHSSDCALSCTCIHYSYNGVLDGFRQCYGFSCYGFDKYYHRAINVQSQCVRSSYIYVSCSNDLKLLIQSMKPGTHIRFGAAGLGTHSGTLLTSNSNTFVMIECNTGDNCDIKVREYTYAQYYGKYTYIHFYDTHNISAIGTYYDSSYHTRACANCAGYMLELHNPVYQSMGDLQHMQLCACCGNVMGVEAHSFDDSSRCVICGYSR